MRACHDKVLSTAVLALAARFVSVRSPSSSAPVTTHEKHTAGEDVLNGASILVRALRYGGRWISTCVQVSFRVCRAILQVFSPVNIYVGGNLDLFSLSLFVYIYRLDGVSILVGARVCVVVRASQLTATHYNILQHAATDCNRLQHTATRYNTL